ncbi:MAG: ABC transporter permease [Acidimicrobiia bacterium]|nr:ABC transporter permease [Acidimicrobiia bacterium]
MALISAAVALAAGLALSAAMVGRPGLRPTAATVSLVAVALVVVGGFTAASVSTPMLLRWAAKRSQSRPGARLFLANLAGNGSRVGGVSLGVAFTVALSVVLGGLAPAMATTVRDNASQLVGAGFAVNTVPFNDATMIDSKIGSDLLERIRTTVAPGTVSREAFILTRTRGLDIAVVASDTPGNRTTVIDGASVPEAISDGVAIGAPLARTLKLAVGDDLEIDTPSGPLTLPIRAVVEYLDNAGLIAIVNMASVDANWGYQAPDPLIVTPTPDQSVSAMRDQVLALDPRIRVADAASLAADSVASINEYLDPFSVLSRMLFIVVGAAATISVGLVAIQRRQEFATLVASGVSTAVLGAITTAEAAVLAGLGAFQGAAVGLLLAGPMRNATSFVVGVRPPPVLPLLPALVAGVAAFTIATAGAIPPAVRLRRIELIDALSGD